MINMVNMVNVGVRSCPIEYRFPDDRSNYRKMHVAGPEYRRLFSTLFSI